MKLPDFYLNDYCFSLNDLPVGSFFEELGCSKSLSIEGFLLSNLLFLLMNFSAFSWIRAVYSFLSLADCSLCEIV